MEIYFMIEAAFCLLLIVFMAAFSLMLAFEKQEPPYFSGLPSPPSKHNSSAHFAENADDWMNGER